MNEMITITVAEYQRLLAAAEELADVAALDSAKAALADGSEELIPAPFVARLLNRESPVRVYRDLRRLTQASLAAAAEVNRVQIAEIEAGRKTGSVETLRRLALALGVRIDDLV